MVRGFYTSEDAEGTDNCKLCKSLLNETISFKRVICFGAGTDAVHLSSADLMARVLMTTPHVVS